MKLRVCPNCGSLETTHPDFSTPGAVPPKGMYKCKKCNYQGIYPIIEKEDYEEFLKDLKNQER